MDFSGKIKELRISKNFTQDQLGELVYVDRATVSKWERGLALPSTKTLLALSKALNVNVNLLASNDVDLPKNILSADEEELVEMYRNCTPSQKEIIYNIIKSYQK